MKAQEMFRRLEENTSNQGSYTISFNDHKTCYNHEILDIKNYYNIEDGEEEHIDWSKDIYNLHWYNYTPVGYYNIYANSMEELLELFDKLLKEEILLQVKEVTE